MERNYWASLYQAHYQDLLKRIQHHIYIYFPSCCLAAFANLLTSSSLSLSDYFNRDLFSPVNYLALNNKLTRV